MTEAWTRKAEQQEIKLKVVGCHVTVLKITHRETLCLYPRIHFVFWLGYLEGHYCLTTDLSLAKKTKLFPAFTYLFTYSVVQSPSWAANWFAASQEIPRISRNPKVHYRTHKRLSLSWARPVQSIYPHPTSWRSILILSTHLRLGLPSGLLPYGFPTKTLYTPLSSPIRTTCPAHLILLDLRIVFFSRASIPHVNVS